MLKIVSFFKIQKNTAKIAIAHKRNKWGILKTIMAMIMMMRTKKLLRTDPVETSFLSLPRDPTVKVGSFVSFCSFVFVTAAFGKSQI